MTNILLCIVPHEANLQAECGKVTAEQYTNRCNQKVSRKIEVLFRQLFRSMALSIFD
jgi:hypothetical protein